MQSSSTSDQVDLHVKTTWLTAFRTVASTILLGVLAARLLSTRPLDGPTTEDIASFVLVGFVYALTLGLGLLLRFGRIGPWVAWVQIAADVVLASCLVFLSGGPDSPFTFVYSIAVIAASVLLYRTGALVAATLSTLGYVVVVALLQTGFGRSATGWSARPISDLALWGSLPVLAQFLVAVLSGYIAEQLFLTGGRLSAREQDLRQLTVLQQNIVTAIPSGLVTCDRHGLVTYVNPAAAQILGLVEEPAGPLMLETILPGALRFKPSVRRAELEVPTAGGPRTLGLTVTPLETGKAGTLVVFQDLTEFRRMEAELKRIDHLASLGRISAQLAHEVRNPLASMRGAAQLLVGDLPGESAPARLAKLIMREADRVALLVEDYLKLARPPPPVLRVERIDHVVAETTEMFRADPLSQGVTLEESLAPVESLVDAGQLRQVLINLLRNAVLATGKGGLVRISVEHGSSGVEIRVWDSAGSLSDTTRIFEPFFSTREGGTGLGLSTVRAIVHAHGGRVEVASSPREGTTFSVCLSSAQGGV